MAEPNGILAAAQAASKKGPPPVHLWNPPYCGEMDLRIARDGTWFHEGAPIGRAPLVKLFAGILKLEEGRFYLVTPVEKLGITVEDAPFIAVDFTVSGSGRNQDVTFTTNVGDDVPLGPDNPLRMGDGAPYVMVRRGLEARVDRKSFYRLIDLGEAEGDWFGLWSRGHFFPVIPVADLQDSSL
ncbi:DUF1285 domain-containing protein [Gemmobacter denitrificans]|uniref:DUF1285 domain-containing protein n=1 Tax=Gemmobacter denitrificans TaxID=3123040 RepID=A0ABU8BU66_9RHOB